MKTKHYIHVYCCSLFNHFLFIMMLWFSKFIS